MPRTKKQSTEAAVREIRGIGCGARGALLVVVVVLANRLEQLTDLLAHQEAIVDQVHIEPALGSLELVDVALVVGHRGALGEFDHVVQSFL